MVHLSHSPIAKLWTDPVLECQTWGSPQYAQFVAQTSLAASRGASSAASGTSQRHSCGCSLDGTCCWMSSCIIAVRLSSTMTWVLWSAWRLPCSDRYSLRSELAHTACCVPTSYRKHLLLSFSHCVHSVLDYNVCVCFTFMSMHLANCFSDDLESQLLCSDHVHVSQPRCRRSTCLCMHKSTR